jgi:hypothetical protein
MKIDFIGVIVPYSMLFPLIIALFRWKFLTTQAKYLLLYIAATVLINFTAIIIGRYLHKNNMPLVHLLTAVDIVILLFYYKALLNNQHRFRLYFLLAAIFVAFCIMNAIFFQSIYTYSSYTRSVEAIICLLFALNYFARLASYTTTAVKVIRQPDFYFNAGIFLYFSGAFMLFIFSNFVISILSKTNFLIIWNIHGALLLLMYILFCIGFLLCKK